MRVYFTLLFFLVVATLLASSSSTSASTPQFIQSTDAADTELRGGRSLRTIATNNQATDAVDEERAAIPLSIKRLGTATSKWFGDKSLATKLHLKAMLVELDNAVEKLVKQGVDPNRAYKVLKLEKDSNRYINEYKSGEFTLWYKLVTAYQVKNPRWINKYPDVYKEFRPKSGLNM